jgi:hypothetical protein
LLRRRPRQLRRAHGQVPDAVPVEVPTSHGQPAAAPGPGADEACVPVGGAIRVRGRHVSLAAGRVAVADVDGTSVGSTVTVARRADRELGQAVAVDVRDPGQGLPEPVAGARPDEAVPVERGHTVVTAEVLRAVAVVVDEVADLGDAGMHRGTGVVAVGEVRHVTCRRLAGRPPGLGVAEPITVRVGEPHASVQRGVLVDGPVAVVVEGVADLRSRGVHQRVHVVAVAADVDGLPEEHARVLAGPDAHGLVAEAVAVAVRVPVARIDRARIIDAAVAVVVDRVTAALLGARVDRGLAVVAVAVAGVEAVPVGVDGAHGAVAVVVGGVSAVPLGGEGVDGTVPVVAVAGGDDRPRGCHAGQHARVRVVPPAVPVGIRQPDLLVDQVVSAEEDSDPPAAADAVDVVTPRTDDQVVEAVTVEVARRDARASLGVPGLAVVRALVGQQSARARERTVGRPAATGRRRAPAVRSLGADTHVDHPVRVEVHVPDDGAAEQVVGVEAVEPARERVLGAEVPERCPAEEQVGRAALEPASLPRTHPEVVDTVAVHVARGRDSAAETVVAVAPELGRCAPQVDVAGQRAARQHVGRAGTAALRRLARGADGQVVRAVAVHVADTAHGAAHAVVVAQAGEAHVRRGCAHGPEQRPVEHVGTAVVREAHVRQRGTHHDVGDAVTVEVARRGDLRAEVVARGLADQDGGGDGVQVGDTRDAAAGDHPDHACGVGGRRRGVRAHDEVVATVTVEITRVGQRGAGAQPAGRTGEQGVRRRHREIPVVRDRAVEDRHGAGGPTVRAVPGDAPHEVGVAVTVEVTHGDRAAHALVAELTGDAGVTCRQRRCVRERAERVARIGDGVRRSRERQQGDQRQTRRDRHGRPRGGGPPLSHREARSQTEPTREGLLSGRTTSRRHPERPRRRSRGLPDLGDTRTVDDSATIRIRYRGSWTTPRSRCRPDSSTGSDRPPKASRATPSRRSSSSTTSRSSGWTPPCAGWRCSSRSASTPSRTPPSAGCRTGPCTAGAAGTRGCSPHPCRCRCPTSPCSTRPTSVRPACSSG